MAQIPVPRSFPQVVGDMIDAFLSRYGLKALKAGSPVLSLIEAAAQSDVRNSQDIFQLLNANSLDNAELQALDRIGADELVARISESPSSGLVNISDTSFAKISSKIYQGLPAPIVGTTTLNIADGSSFGSTGNLYIGRGTANFEGPIAYTAVTAVPSPANPTYWTITLSSPTAKFHNLGEPVTKAQGGNRLVGAGTVVQTPQGNLSSSVQFSVLYSATVPDGETEVLNVQVVAKRPGVIGNVAAGSISQFQAPPFNGAAVTNPRPLSNGLATESDDAYRERIRNARASRSRGTALALKTFTIGAVSPDENKRVISASVVTNAGLSTTMYIDDGTGYEETSVGVAYETLMDSAGGGESYFQISEDPPITKANLKTLASSPFALSPGSKLSFSVSSTVYTHTFSSGEFRDISAATAYEVVSSINADTGLGWSARTSGSGSQVIVFAKSDTNEDLINEAVADDANEILQFPGTPAYTTRLYKNDRLLTKDGKGAYVLGNSISMWGTLTSPETLTVSVDGTSAQTYTFTDADFISANTGFVTLGINSVNSWVSVINAKIPGITASVSGNGIKLESNLGPSARAGVSIPLNGGTLVSKLMFSSQTAAGLVKDYILDRNTGQITLTVPLSALDKLTLGSKYTRSFIDSLNLGETIVPTTAPTDFWFSLDGDMTLVPTGVVQGTVLTASVSEVDRWGYRLRLTSNAALDLFPDVAVGDWVIPWDSSFTSYMRSPWRVARVGSPATYIEIEKPSMMAARSGHTSTVLADGRVLLVGGMSGEKPVNASYIGRTPTSSCEIYDPNTATWMPATAMGTARANHTATLLSNGKVVVIGGSSNGTDNGALSSGEVYNPVTNTWTAIASIPAGPRWKHVALLVASGDILVTAGKTTDSTYLASTYTYTPGTDTWSAALGAIGTARANAMGMVLNNGDVIIAGGENGSPLSSDEFSTPPWAAWTTTGAQLSVARHSGGIVKLGNGKVLVAGGVTSVDEGTTGITVSGAADIYTAAGVGAHGVWTIVPSLGIPTGYNVLTVATSGNVVCAFGYRNPNDDRTEVGAYDGTIIGWAKRTGVQPLGAFKRLRATGAALGSNVVVYAGGADTSDFHPAASSEKFTAPTSIFTAPAGLVRAAGTVTGTTTVPHGLTIGLTYTYTLQPGEADFPVGDKVITITGASTFTYVEAGAAVASANEQSFTGTGVWSQSDRVLGANPITITSDVGFSVARTKGFLQHVALPISLTYTATSIASIISSQLSGVFTSVFNNGQVRISTDSYQDQGDIGLVDQTNSAFGLSKQSAIRNIAGQQGAVESRDSERGTPDFRYIMLVGSGGPLSPIVDLESEYNRFRLPSPGYSLLVTRSYFDAVNPTTSRWGTNRGVYTGISSISHDGKLAYITSTPTIPTSTVSVAGGGLVRVSNVVTATTSTAHGFYLGQIVTLSAGEANFPAGEKIVDTVVSATVFTYRETSPDAVSVGAQSFTTNPSAVRLWEPIQKVTFVSPYSIAPADSLTAVVDGDVSSKRYAINMFRNLKTVGGTYAIQNDFKDKDGGSVAISKTFGNPYDFNDFAVFMPARTKTHDGDATKRILWRYKRLGPDGNMARLRYVLPTAPDSGVGVSIDNLTNEYTNLNVTLASGGLITGYSVRSISYIGMAATAVAAGIGTLVYTFHMVISSGTRDGANNTTMTLTLPAGVTDHGLQIGNIVYINSNNVNFQSGNYTLTNRTATTIVYTEVAAAVGATANPGTASRTSDAGEVTLAGPAIPAGTFFRLESTTGAPVPFSRYTLRLSSASNDNVAGSAENFPKGSVSTVLAWYQVVDTTGLKFFSNPAQDVGTIETAINALASSPVTATSSVGAGGGTIDMGSAEEASSYPTWFNLTDGMNFVQSTIPATSPVDYQLVFKMPITASLATNSDWANETVVIAPITAKSIAAWMNTLTVSGFSSVGTADVTSAGKLNEDPLGINLILGGSRVQLATQKLGSGGSVQVQGGTANAASAPVIGAAVNTIPPSVTVGAAGIVRTGGGLVTVTSPEVHNLQPGSFFTISIGETNFRNTLVSVDSVTSPYIFTYFDPGVNAATAFDETIQELPYAVATVPMVSTPGLVAGAWAKIANLQTLAKSILLSGTILTEIRPDGTFLLASSTWNAKAPTSALPIEGFLEVERFGRFVGYTWTGSTSITGISNVVEGDWVRITAPRIPTGGAHQIMNSNTGIFRVVRVTASTDGRAAFTVWVVNDTAIDDEPGQCDVVFLDYNSVLPGDTLKISTLLWGKNNTGNWTIASVGSALSSADVGGLVRAGATVTVTTTQPHNLAMNDYFSISPGETNFPQTFGGSTIKQVASVVSSTKFTYTEAGAATTSLIGQKITGQEFQNPLLFVVSTVDRVPVAVSSPGALPSSLVHVVEGSNYLSSGQLDAYKKILSITQNANDVTLADLKFSNSLKATHISSSASSVVEMLDKLEFPTSVFMGIDGYAHSTGLVGISNKIVYGDPSDPATYPGVAADGASVSISGPLVKRIQVSLQIRIRTGVVQADVTSAVRSAVATLINQAPVGAPIALSNVVAVASKVGGVMAVTVLSPTYTSVNDLIPVQPTEKPLVLNLDTDIQVSFVG